jgi:hypothetical protein
MFTGKNKLIQPTLQDIPPGKEDPMLRYPELPLLSELPAIDDDPALFDPSPEWFVPGLRSPVRDGYDDDGLGLRALADRVPSRRSRRWPNAA